MKLLKFYADWCQPCKQLSELIRIEKLREPDESINIETDPAKGMKYGVKGIPCLIWVNEEGAELGRIVGMPSKAVLQEFLNRFN